MPQSTSPLLDLPGLHPVTDAVERLAVESRAEERGAVFTRREVVDFILDLVGYTTNQPLTEFRLLEPSFGDGDFLLPALGRLIKSAMRTHRRISVDLLETAIRGVELHRDTFERTRTAARVTLFENGLEYCDADRLLQKWLIQGDFLLESLEHQFSHVIGNPPYIRQESIPDVLIAEYRHRFSTIYDRADIYVPFIEQSLKVLNTGGKLGFICADRWMKNRYGKKLRNVVSRNFSLTAYIDMFGTNAFNSEVSAYPAITIISRSKNPITRVYAHPNIESKFLRRLASDLTMPKLPQGSPVREIRAVTSGSEPWILHSFDQLALVRRLESEFPVLERAGCKVGIGVATGADRAFIGKFDALDVEPSRKLPLVMTGDILEGEIKWKGLGVINPFGNDGKLVDLEEYPKLCAFLEARREQIAGRHVAMKNPRSWYRTIDRIYPELARREKLLIPDIKADASVVYEGGKLYPHHNLYFVISDEWDVRALQTVMQSGIARLFVALYSTRMRGGYLRFQAQYLRKICIPRWRDVSLELREQLTNFSNADDPRLRKQIVSSLYRLGAADIKLIEGFL